MRLKPRRILAGHLLIPKMTGLRLNRSVVLLESLHLVKMAEVDLAGLYRDAATVTNKVGRRFVNAPLQKPPAAENLNGFARQF
jgi:hypothetical protein